MGKRALEFSEAHPDPEPGTANAVARLKELLARANEAAAGQRAGIVQVRSASERKEELRRQMLDVPIMHLAEVGRAAARDEHELGTTFRFKPSASTFLAFQTAAATMLSAAQAHREVLVKHGLSESVLEGFAQQLGEFAAAIARGNEGRAAHVGATRNIRAASAEIFRVVRILDGRNRHRFGQEEQLLGSWISASTVVGTPRPDTPTEGGKQEGGEVRPAA